MHSVVFRTRRSEDATTSLRSELLNTNGSVQEMKRPRQGRRWLTPLLLWIITLCLWLPGLGNLPLRDWDEGRVATVARSTTGIASDEMGAVVSQQAPRPALADGPTHSNHG